MIALMPQDASRKLLFSHPRMVEDLLGGFVAEPWSDALDFSTLENRSAAFVSDGLRQRCGDSLWRLRYGETCGCATARPGSTCRWSSSPPWTGPWPCAC